MADEKKNLEIMLARDGEVVLEVEAEITEEQISNELDWISIKLDGMYGELTTAMKPFQEEWDAGSVAAIRNALKEGAASGGGAWVESLGDIFDGEIWASAGRWISDTASSVRDRAESYAKERLKKIEENYEKGNYFSIAWWSRELTDTLKGDLKKLEEAYYFAGQVAKDSQESVEKAVKLWKHREKIANLPELLAAGDVKAIQDFVDTVLMDVDKELALGIKDSAEFHAVLELINDPDSVLTYLAYISLVFEAIPLNFYAYIGGKAGAFIVCEIILLLITALLSAGAAVAARVAMLGARLAATSTKVANLPRKIRGAAEAIRAFELVVKRFIDVAGALQKLGHKLRRARGARGYKLKGSSRTTLTAKRESHKRDRKCRICHSTAHPTPARVKRGCVTYYTPKAAGVFLKAAGMGAIAAGVALSEEEKQERRKLAKELEQEQQEASAVAAAEENEREDPPSDHEPPETEDDDDGDDI